jgi:hypothetical protein
MSDIFISYEKSDRPTAEMLAQRLRGRGWTTFWDRTILIGQDWHEKIEEELSKARCVIVLWSRASIKSGWVRDEAREAINRGVCVPVLIGNIQPPLGFRNIQAGDLTNWDGAETAAGFQQLIADIAGHIGPGSTPMRQQLVPPAVAPRADPATPELKLFPSKAPPFMTQGGLAVGSVVAAVGAKGLHYLLNEQPGTGVVVFAFLEMLGVFGVYWGAVKKMPALVGVSLPIAGMLLLMLIIYGSNVAGLVGLNH